MRACDAPAFAASGEKSKGSKRKGILYQEKVVRYLDEQYPDWVGVPGLWFKFSDFRGERYAQADWLGINVSLGRLCIVEVKLSRVPDAWWQLNRLYRPLVQRLFPEWEIALVEVVSKVYHVAVPEEVKVVHSLDDARPGRTSLMRVGA